jgi:hypothetical protein
LCKQRSNGAALENTTTMQTATTNIHLVRFSKSSGETYDWEIITTKDEDESVDQFEEYIEDRYESDAATGYHIVEEKEDRYTLLHSGDDVTDRLGK